MRIGVECACAHPYARVRVCACVLACWRSRRSLSCRDVAAAVMMAVAGNVSTPDAVRDLESWGADSVKVGIGPGSACTTFSTTGFGSRGMQAAAVMDCASVARVPIIADGGIKVPGDIAKSIVLGADMVMIGGMLSGFIDSPGGVVVHDGRRYKDFWGSASAYQVRVMIVGMSGVAGLVHLRFC